MRISRCLQTILVCRDKFDERNVTDYLDEYKTQVDVQKVSEDVVVQNFASIVVTCLKDRVESIIEKSGNED